jgi:hypothetical protein
MILQNDSGKVNNHYRNNLITLYAGSCVPRWISYSKLSIMTPNYCSKFIWQAFYYGSSFDSTVRERTDADSANIAPSIFTNTQQFVSRGSFIAK